MNINAYGSRWQPIQPKEFYRLYNDFKNWYTQEVEPKERSSNVPVKKGRGSKSPEEEERRITNLHFMAQKMDRIKEKYIKHGSCKLPNNDVYFLQHQLLIAKNGRADF